MLSVSYKVYLITNGNSMIPKIEQMKNIQKLYNGTLCVLCNCVFFEYIGKGSSYIHLIADYFISVWKKSILNQ